MLHSVSLPGGEHIEVQGGLVELWGQRASIPAALGFALFDVPSRGLPTAGQVELEISGPLDGRRYAIRRALDVAAHWQVVDRETGWTVAGGPGEVPQWLAANLDMPAELALPALLREHVSFSVPVTVAWLLEEPARRETKLRAWLRTQRYLDGLAWLAGVRSDSELKLAALSADVRESEGRDAPYEHVQRAFDTARRGSLAAADDVAAVQRELTEASATRAKLDGLEEELTEVKQATQAQAQEIAAAEAVIERWQQWQAIHERAQRAMREHEDAWRAYQEACIETGKLESDLSGLEAVHGDLHSVAGNVMALRREESLLESQLKTIQEAESSAAALADMVEQQRQLEQQVHTNQERALRLDLITRALQQTIAESKRTEVLLADVDHQLAEIEQLRPQVNRIKKLQHELEEQESLLREAGRQVDHLRFLEGVVRAVTIHRDELHKGISATERLAVKVAGNGSGEGDDRTMSGHLREAIEHQLEGLERQLRDWQAQSRELASAPMKVNQLRAAIHQLEQELDSVRGVEIRLGGVATLKQHRKYLSERVEELKKATEARLKEQQECTDAPAKLAQSRQELSSLRDPRSQQAALLRTAARKHAVESEIKQVQRRRGEAEDRQKDLEGRLAALNGTRETLRSQERRRDDHHEGYCAYVAQQTIVELASGSAAELEPAQERLASLRRQQQETEAQVSALSAAIEPLRGSREREAGLEKRLEALEVRSGEWKARYQGSSDDYSAADENRAELKRRQRALEVQRRAVSLLDRARADVEQAEIALGTKLRRELAEVASPLLQRLLGNGELSLSWPFREAPAVVKAGTSRGLADVDLTLQAYCALALRLALAADGSRFQTVFITDLGPLRQSEDFMRRLPAASGFAQILLPAA